MSNLKSNLRVAASENFKLYPQCYPVLPADSCPSFVQHSVPSYETPNGLVLLTDEGNRALIELAVAYGENDGFYDAGMTAEEVEKVVRDEFENFLRSE